MRLLPSRRIRPRRTTTQTPSSGATTEAGAQASTPQRLPDPAKPPQARGGWEHAALVNVDITELVKRQVGSQTPPWKK